MCHGQYFEAQCNDMHEASISLEVEKQPRGVLRWKTAWRTHWGLECIPPSWILEWRFPLCMNTILDLCFVCNSSHSAIDWELAGTKGCCRSIWTKKSGATAHSFSVARVQFWGEKGIEVCFFKHLWIYVLGIRRLAVLSCVMASTLRPYYNDMHGCRYFTRGGMAAKGSAALKDGVKDSLGSGMHTPFLDTWVKVSIVHEHHFRPLLCL